MTPSQNQDSGAKDIIDGLVKERNLILTDPSDVPDRIWHRILCGCAQCQEKLKK